MTTAVGDVTKEVSAVAPVFVSIDTEAYRTYHFSDGSKFTIIEPVKLSVKRNADGRDSHRIIDTAGKSYYIPVGWVVIEWSGKDGPAYSF